MHTLVILLVVAALAYFLFLKPKTSIVGTYTIRGPQGQQFWYFGPDKTIRIFSRPSTIRGAEVLENPSTATYDASGSSIRVKMSGDTAPIVGHPELKGKLIVFRAANSRQQGLLKLSDKLLAPKQMAEALDTQSISGVITTEQLNALIEAARPFMQ
jgi:hypothetical protein